MAAMWMATSLLVWALAATPSFLHALAVGACVTPTDPVLSAVIVKGKFADHNIPKDLQNLIIAESGTNDGLGYPFLFFALYLIKYVGAGATYGGPGDAMGLWVVYTWGYVIALSILYGAVVGWVGKELLHWAEERNYVDRESFLVFAIALALFVLGTCGLLGTDDVLACFIAGNTFTWDDWFRLRTKDDSLQPTIDMLLNVTIFLWYGAYLPWDSFADNLVLPTWRLVILGLLVLVLRRLPWIFGMHRAIHQIRHTRQAIFVGFFGPIGVSAIFYLFISLDFINEHLSDENGVARADVANLGETIRVIVWFLAVCSIVSPPSDPPPHTFTGAPTSPLTHLNAGRPRPKHPAGEAGLPRTPSWARAEPEPERRARRRRGPPSHPHTGEVPGRKAGRRQDEAHPVHAHHTEP